MESQVSWLETVQSLLTISFCIKWYLPLFRRKTLSFGMDGLHMRIETWRAKRYVEIYMKIFQLYRVVPYLIVTIYIISIMKLTFTYVYIYTYVMYMTIPVHICLMSIHSIMVFNFPSARHCFFSSQNVSALLVLRMWRTITSIPSLTSGCIIFSQSEYTR